MTQAVDYTLYGVPHSLYTGIVRCYLRTQGIAYRELMTSQPRFAEHIVPRIGRGIIPVLETRQGDIIQDSVDIIDYFETRGVPYPAYPSSALQRVVAIIIQYYGSQAMLRHAMHYRWSYREQQEKFLRDAFASGSGPQAADKIMSRMNSYLPALGVTPETIPAIEQSYGDLLDTLEAHFTEHPYLLGGRPSVADYGLIGPMFAHLGRDPVPAQIMKLRAPRVFRWVERMTAPGLDAPEFPDYGSEFLSDDRIPSTLEPLLKQIAAEIFPELSDKLNYLDEHVSQLKPSDGQPVSEKPHQRNIGVVDTQFYGIPMRSAVAPYIVYILRRAGRALDSYPQAAQQQVREYLQGFGLEQALLEEERNYSVGRREHIEVWER